MIFALRATLISLTLVFTYFFGKTMEQFLLQVVRLFVALDSSNAVQFNLILTAILLFPLILFTVFLSIATIDDPDLRQRFQRIGLGMLLALFLFRVYQVWWLLKAGAFSGDGDLQGGVETFTSGQIYFLEQVLPYVILGAASGLIPAVQESRWDSAFFATLSAFSIFIWLIATHKLPPTQDFSQSLFAFFLTVFSGFGTGFLVKRIKES